MNTLMEGLTAATHEGKLNTKYVTKQHKQDTRKSNSDNSVTKLIIYDCLLCNIVFFPIYSPIGLTGFFPQCQTWRQ